MNKAELINAIASESGLTKVDSKKALDGLIVSISKELKKGGKVALVGFGTYSVTQKSARTGINPRTKQQIKIAAKKVVKFKPGADLAKAVESKK
ncbi:MAG: HU family DNA-binding protein [Dysgonamonadaceae bacterium]|jgi:DNA-binding protein HU-beta|nr:HU family DNA-binding protein [Dysgonamonadaceae bacterium]